MTVWTLFKLLCPQDLNWSAIGDVHSREVKVLKPFQTWIRSTEIITPQSKRIIILLKFDKNLWKVQNYPQIEQAHAHCHAGFNFCPNQFMNLIFWSSQRSKIRISLGYETEELNSWECENEKMRNWRSKFSKWDANLATNCDADFQDTLASIHFRWNRGQSELISRIHSHQNEGNQLNHVINHD
jgi:hypothetical protein